MIAANPRVEPTGPSRSFVVLGQRLTRYVSHQVLYYGVSDSAISNNSSKDRKSDGMFV